MEAEQIVFLILIFVVVGILFILNILTKAYVWGNWLNRMKNSSGNYDTTKILMMVAAAVALYFLLSFLFMRKGTVRASLTRSKDENN
jgi:uncharacterized membrane protein